MACGNCHTPYRSEYQQREFMQNTLSMFGYGFSAIGTWGTRTGIPGAGIVSAVGSLFENYAAGMKAYTKTHEEEFSKIKMYDVCLIDNPQAKDTKNKDIISDYSNQVVVKPMPESPEAPSPSIPSTLTNRPTTKIQPMLEITEEYTPSPQPNKKDNDSTNTDGNKIICVELFKQGLLDPIIFKADEAFGEYLYRTNTDALVGYQLWAKPIVKLMRKSPIITKIVYFFAKPWTEEMAYFMGIRNTGNTAGKILMGIGIPFCEILGKLYRDYNYNFGIIVTLLIIMPVYLLIAAKMKFCFINLNAI